jgi:hypothetical protein
MYVNGKITPVETIPGMMREGIKENDWGGHSSMIYLIHLKTFVTATMYPAQQQKKW